LDGRQRLHGGDQLGRPGARRYLVTVLVGQAGGRLRVHRRRIEAAAANGGWRDNGTTDVLGLTGWARD
jgi:hypothetical protein